MMKRRFFRKLALVLLLIGVMAGCSRQEDNVSDENGEQNGQTSSSLTGNNSDQAIANVLINVNDAEFTIQMNDTATGRALVSMIPSTSMRLPTSYEQDGVLKYYDMAREVVSDPEELSSVSAGELLLDGNDRLLLYYEDTELNGSYTRVGRIEDATGLAEALGDSDVVFTVSRISQ